MSIVTNIIIKTRVDEHDVINYLNWYLVKQEKGILKQTDNFAGGRKAMECDIFMGAFNMSDTGKIIEIFKTKKGEYDQLFIMEQDDDLFKEIK